MSPFYIIINLQRFSVEIQVVGIGHDQETILTLVYLFEENELIDNSFFYEMGFGNYDLIQLELFNENKESFFQVQNPFSLKTLMDSHGKNLLLYEGKSNIYCQNSIVIISNDIGFIGSGQMIEFDFYLTGKYSDDQLTSSSINHLKSSRPSVVYSNLIFSQNVIFQNLPNFHLNAKFSFGTTKPLEEDLVVPADLYLQRMMFTKNLDGQLPLGFFDHSQEDLLAIWDPRVAIVPKIELSPIFKRSSHFKYIGSCVCCIIEF